MDIAIDKTNETVAPAPKKFLIISVAALLICIETIFIFPEFDNYGGIIILGLLPFIYYVYDQKVFVSVILIFANDALGTVFLGKGSLYYIIFIFFMIDLLRSKTFSNRQLVLSFACIYATFIPSICHTTNLKEFFWTTICTEQLILLYFTTQENIFFKQLKEGITCIVLLMAIHLLSTGGMFITETRSGLIGLGIGDPNFSAFALCLAIFSVLNIDRLPLLVKIVAVVIFLRAVVETLSTSGFLAICICTLCSEILNVKDKRNYKSLCVKITVLIICYIFVAKYISTSNQLHIVSLDNFIDRLETKFFLAADRDYSEATTLRSDISSFKLNYIIYDAPFIKQLIGFNSVFVKDFLASHNTYIDICLLYGFTGAFLIVFFFLKRLIACLKRFWAGEKQLKYPIVMKIACLFFISSLSIYSGPLWSLTFLLCLVI
jgi:hypothetical protein